MREHNCSAASSEKIELFNKAVQTGSVEKVWTAVPLACLQTVVSSFPHHSVHFVGAVDWPKRVFEERTEWEQQ